MSIIENMRLALSGIRASKMRSLLTMLGIIIGIAAVISIVTVGNSLTASVNSTMEEFGANQIYIFVTNRESGANNEMYDSDMITQEMIEDMQKEFGDKIQSVSLNAGGFSGETKNGPVKANVTLYGGNADFVASEGFKIISGRDINQRDVDRSSNVIVIMDKYVKKVFPPNVDPIGEEVKINTPGYGMLTYTVVGVGEYKMPAMMANYMSEDDMPTVAVIPISTMNRLIDSEDSYNQFGIKFPPNVDSKKLTKDLETFFEDNYYKANKNFTVGVQNMESMIEQFTTMLSTISLAIVLIAFISLLVGGIGVMNIMLVSVTERTREIGTRKAIGAKSSAIRIQFLIESIILCGIGGILGILVGLGLGILGASLLGFPAVPSMFWVIFSVVTSMVVGILSGLYPANKAAMLDPIEALRYE